MINKERIAAGSPPVTLGTNDAAQLHAEHMLEHCFLGHWGTDGMKPYMRYTLSGGTQNEGENVSGRSKDCEPWSHFASLEDLTEEMQIFIDGFMSSPWHRRQMLRPSHKKVNIGLAFNRVVMQVVNQFTGDYVEFTQKPVIRDSRLLAEGNLYNNAVFAPWAAGIYYDRPFAPVSKAQLVAASCYGAGPRIALIARATEVGESRSERESKLANDMRESTVGGCPEPRDITFDADGTPIFPEPVTTMTPWVIPDVWLRQNTYFKLDLPMGDLLAQYGPGVYTLSMWGMDADDNDLDYAIVEYSIFYQIEPDWPP